jgi:hypothetical protein
MARGKTKNSIAVKSSRGTLSPIETILTDQVLFERYNLTREVIDFFESKIRRIEANNE